MPGARLTHDDRRAIAAGLASGRTVTEIAAGLGRPLSTVTREIARNGGVQGYDADDAQDATTSRASRRRPPVGRRDVVLEDLHGRFTALLVGTGLSRMTARVLAALYLADSGALTAAELTQQLQVSPASVSKAVAELEQQALVRREREPGRRRDRYVIDADAWFDGWLASARQNAALADFARQGVESLGPGSPAGARLTEFGDFFDHVGRAMLDAAEEWRRAYAAGR